MIKSRDRVLITGADGFIGSHLTELLVSKGYEVRALVQYNSFNSWGWLDKVTCKNEIEVVSGDIRDLAFCKTITKGIDTVFHLAALIAIPFSYTAPQSYIDTNVSGTLNICQAAKDNNVSRVIHTSTSEVYGTAQYVPIDEKHPLQPQSPYSASKIGADAIAMSFYYSFDLPLTVARPFNTYGPRQSARAVIPTIITQIAQGEKKLKLGQLSSTRDLNYVEDTCRGFLLLAYSNDTVGEIVNIGSNKEISVLELSSMIKDLMDSDVDIVQEEQRMRPDTSEVYRLVCDSTKIKQLTDFKPKFTLREGLEKTCEWFTDKNNLGKYKANIYNV